MSDHRPGSKSVEAHNWKNFRVIEPQEAMFTMHTALTDQLSMLETTMVMPQGPEPVALPDANDTNCDASDTEKNSGDSLS